METLERQQFASQTNHDVRSEVERLEAQARGFREVARWKRNEITFCLSEARRIEALVRGLESTAE